MDQLPEVWKVVPGFENYSVSNCGRVRRDVKTWSHEPKILKPFTISGGYQQIHLFCGGVRKAFRVHRLVLALFDRPPQEGEEGNHKDGDKSKNGISNLEWVFPNGNMKHAYDSGLHSRQVGDKSHFAKLSLQQVREIRDKMSVGVLTCISIANEYGVCRSTVYRIRDGKSWC